MGISRISSASSYEEWKLLNAQKEQAEEAASASDVSRSRQIDSIKAAVSQEDISLSETTGSPIDTVEISSEGRAFLESSQAEANAELAKRAALEASEDSSFADSKAAGIETVE